MTADVTSFLRRSARVAPLGVAVASPDGEQTYAELMAQVDELARSLPPSDQGPEPIAVVTGNDPITPCLYLAVIAAGHAVVPLSSRLPHHVIARIAETAGIRLGLLSPSAADQLGSLTATADNTRWVIYGWDPRDTSLPAKRAEVPSGTAMVPFTSGTTGEPKGVILTHTNLIANALTAGYMFGVNSPNCHVNPVPLAHFTGASRVILAVLNAGTHVVLPEFDPGLVFESVARWAGTHLTIAPTMAASLLEAEPEQFNLTSLETLIYGTSPMPMPVARDLVKRMSCGLINGYGLTESAGLATALNAASHRQAVENNDDDTLGSVGQPVPGVELRLLDEHQNEVGPGQAGEVALRGLKVSPGYLSNPQATAEKHLPGGWILTGDEGLLTTKSNLRLLGRLDDMIITGGLNVQPREVEIEASLYEGVAECAGFGVPSKRWGEELHLAVASAPGVAVDTDALRMFLRGRVDAYKVPKQIHLVDQLPLSSLGKIQRRQLAQDLDVSSVESPKGQ
jgi:acyl-CoA synthetase (AMP-forming)/AMP-acid ligase II